MASKLGPQAQAKKDRLIVEGCKVVERSWGHLVIMPNMGMALSYFKEALDRITNDHQYEYWAETNHKQSVSPEYYEKYKKQFAHLKTPETKERLYWIIQDTIREGDPRKIEQVSRLSQKLTELVYEINPSLHLDVQRERAENGDIWDAGLIGADDPRPCWDTRPSQKIKRGQGGDGAYRIIINTDTSFGRSDGENCLVLCAMINVLQQYADVEIWVQQGWVSGHDSQHGPMTANDCGNPMNGITLFPAFRGSGLHPAQIMFWAGHPMRDSIFSNLINKRIGRTSSGCSYAAELDCDLYTRNGCFDDMPHLNLEAEGPAADKQLKVMAAWTATQLSKVLLEEEDLSNIVTE